MAAAVGRRAALPGSRAEAAAGCGEGGGARAGLAGQPGTLQRLPAAAEHRPQHQHCSARQLQRRPATSGCSQPQQVRRSCLPEEAVVNEQTTGDCAELHINCNICCANLQY